MTDPIEVLVALRRYGLENDRFDASVARAHDVSLAEMKAIDHIQAEGELTPRQLGERLSLSSGCRHGRDRPARARRLGRAQATPE